MIKTAVVSTAVVSGFRNRGVDDKNRGLHTVVVNGFINRGVDNKNRGFKYSGC